ncbi:hypothetical protein EJ03DRAFT_166626 [Teratosphaeria nubilosa]|uniref:Uncharacterized protein n=1 Tax=Teratosphaeria nubilosa TaxID=161662 RepID=A0A6G1L1X7_9PEZI|nr:hypothetical protein EJ03DRAFT_166626 [Teratosphaeria nubilosa]
MQLLLTTTLFTSYAAAASLYFYSGLCYDQQNFMASIGFNQYRKGFSTSCKSTSGTANSVSWIGVDPKANLACNAYLYHGTGCQGDAIDSMGLGDKAGCTDADGKGIRSGYVACDRY